MKQFHVNLPVDNPRINVAIANRGYTLGVNHLGSQVDGADELECMRARLVRADQFLVEQAGAICCS